VAAVQRAAHGRPPSPGVHAALGDAPFDGNASFATSNARTTRARAAQCGTHLLCAPTTADGCATARIQTRTPRRRTGCRPQRCRLPCARCSRRRCGSAVALGCAGAAAHGQARRRSERRRTRPQRARSVGRGERAAARCCSCRSSSSVETRSGSAADAGQRCGRHLHVSSRGVNHRSDGA
jgi:hypothetical protein